MPTDCCTFCVSILVMLVGIIAMKRHKRYWR